MNEARWILVLVHPDRRDSAALSRAVALAEAMGARLRVLSVEPISARETLLRAWAPEAASSPRSVLPAVGLSARIPAAELVTLRGDPVRGVAAEAGRRGVAMVVLGRSHRSRWARAGRAALHAQLVERVAVPVVVVGPERRRALPAASVKGRPSLTVLSGGRARSTRDEVG